MTHGSALYRGVVTHRRLRPREHRLNYRVFWLLLDLAEIDALDRRLRLFSRNRFNLLSFHDRDHGDGSGGPLRPQIEAYLGRAGIDIEGGPIRLLTMPRVLGYVFNPISLYYCHGADGRLAAVVYEVTSTFGVRHAYVIPVPAEDQAAGRIRQGAMSGERRDLTDANLLSAAAAMPLLTLKVMAAIHWEALKLWLKRIPLTRQPPPAWDPVTIQRKARESRLGR